MNRGMGWPGSTSVEMVPRHSPPRYFTAPTSVMALSRGEPPVVSRSTAQKVTSDRGTARSSVAWCASSLLLPRSCSRGGAASEPTSYRTGVRESSARELPLHKGGEEMLDGGLRLLDVARVGAR